MGLFEFLATANTGVPLLLGTVFAAFGGAIKWMYDQYKEQKRNRMYNVFDLIHEVYQILNILLIQSGGTRITLFKITNGGSIPRVGVPLYATVVYEVIKGQLSSRRDEFKSRSLDAESIGTLCRLTNDKLITAMVGDATLGPVVKESMLAEELTGSEYVEVLAVPDTYYFVSIDYTGAIPNDPKHKNILRGGSVKIGNLLKIEA